MTTKRIATLALSVVLTAATAHAWQPFKSDKYGFSMNIPDNAKGQAKELGDGWAGMYWEAGQAQVFALAKRGVKASRQDMHSFVIKLTKIPGENWKQLAQGTAQGFEHYEGWMAKDNNNAIICLIGVGPIGSYVFFIESTPQAFQTGQKDLESWLNSIKVF